MKVFLPFVLWCSLAGVAQADARAGDPVLGLQEAVRLAREHDPQLDGSRHTQAALQAEAVAAGQLPDPSVSLGVANLPTDTFDPDQEAMTGFRAGITQRFPPGDTLKLRQRRQALLGEEQPWLRADRRASVAVTVSRLWLDAWLARSALALIEDHRDLFEQLVDVAEAGYATAVGRARQQDLTRAQLELIRLEDRLTSLREREEMARQRLAEWVGGAATRPLPGELPGHQGIAVDMREPGDAAARLSRHPAVRALEQRVRARATGVDLARQQYRPGWGLTAEYAHREPEPRGRDRADLLTLGVTFDLPLFTGQRQDKSVEAAAERTAAARTEKSLLLRRMEAKLQARLAELARVEERIALYRDRLLPGMDEQAETSLTAYNNDVGDFAEAVRARIAEMDTRIELLELRVQRRKALAHIDYLLLAADEAGVAAGVEP